jgi:MFS family permease
MKRVAIQSHTLGGLDIGSSLLRQALAFSLADGIMCSVMVALTDTFSVAAAVRLGAPTIAIALLGSGPLLVGSVGQFLLPLFLDKNHSRKFYVVASVRVQAMFLILASITGFLPSPVNAWAYIAAFVLYGSSGNLFTGIWTSWFRDCVPSPVRGRHFAWRNRFFSITQLACAITAGIVSRKYSSYSAPWSLFTVVFFVASLFRFGSSKFLSLQYDPQPMRLPERSQVFNLKPSRHFVWFALSVALLQGTTAIAGPFFNVWFLRDLKFDYLTFSIGQAAMIAGTILFLPVWGKLVDKAGTTFALRISALMCVFVPLPYLFGATPVLVWISNFYSGMSWGGFNIANINYLMHLSEKDKSDNYIGVAAATTAVSTFAFSILGGFLSSRLPTLFVFPLQTLFFLSFICRLLVVLVLFEGLPRLAAQVTRTRHSDIAG